MDAQNYSLEEVSSILTKVRQNPKTLHKFPKEVWMAITQLTTQYSIEQISKQLQLNPNYLQRKINQYNPQPMLDFQEVVLPAAIHEKVQKSVILSSDRSKFVSDSASKTSS